MGYKFTEQNYIFAGFLRYNDEKRIQVAPSINENRLPPNNSMDFQTIKIVAAPKRAGKNFTQNTVLPNMWIITDIHEVIGGTD